MTNDPIFANLIEHAMIFFGGATAMGLIAHAVNTFPTPKNQYAAWALGVVQFAVGQRIAAQNTLKGMDSVVTSVAKQP